MSSAQVTAVRLGSGGPAGSVDVTVERGAPSAGISPPVGDVPEDYRQALREWLGSDTE